MSGDTDVLRLRFQEECMSTTEAEWPEGDDTDEAAEFAQLPGSYANSSEEWSVSDCTISDAEVLSVVNDDGHEFAGSNTELQADLLDLGVPIDSEDGE
jgi:hypothetical protein